jgi:hypothetical protein
MQSTNVKQLLDKYGLRCEEDELIASHVEGHARWVARLSNGLSIYQDDFRQYEQFTDERNYSTWTRLRDYCLKEKVSVTALKAQFRSNVHWLVENAEGYYFCKAAMGMFGNDDTWHYFVVGTVNNGKLITKRFKTPEMISDVEDEREIRKDDLCLILREDLR